MVFSTNLLKNQLAQPELRHWERAELERNLQLASGIKTEQKVDAAARKIITTPMPVQEKQEALFQLAIERVAQLQHVAVNGIKGTAIFFNMQQLGLAPTPLCPAYNKMRLPTISSYHTIGANAASVLLDPRAICHVPAQVLEQAGDLAGKQVELFWTAIDGRPFQPNGNNFQINLCTHPWSHPRALDGDDVKHNVKMGVFPEIGFQSLQTPESIAFNALRPMEVYSHPGDDKVMLYSPNNAHFEAIADAPFGIFWTVTQKDDRIAFTKMLVIFNYDHPICASLVKSIRDCDGLNTHLTRLKDVKKEIQNTFSGIIDQFEQNNPFALQLFDQLPPTSQADIFKETWLQFNSPQDIHSDFGRASFENDSSLKKEYHCSNQQRVHAIRQFAARLEYLLVDSQIELMFNSQSLVKGDNVLKMMECAELFLDKKEQVAIELFNSFSQEERSAVLLAIWELSKCPRGNLRFAEETLFYPLTPALLKAEAVLLAASRQNAQFDQPLIEGQPVVPAENPVFAANTAHPSSNNRTSAQDVLNGMIALAFENDFANMESSQRKTLTMGLFTHLPEDVKNAIYGKVYEYSTDESKGGDGWGQNHVADDLNALILALQETLGD
jgi:hypothetical protein